MSHRRSKKPPSTVTMLPIDAVSQVPFETLKERRKQHDEARRQAIDVSCQPKKKLKKNENPELKEKRRDETIRRTAINKTVVDKYMNQQFIKSFTSDKSKHLKVERDSAKHVAEKSISKRRLPRKSSITKEVLLERNKKSEQLVLEKLKESKKFRAAQETLARIYADFTT